MKRWLKAELHTHTAEDPADGQRIVFHSPDQLIDTAAERGFEVLAITNHDQMLFDDRWEEYARVRGILLIPGVEATLRGKHVLLYNFSNYDASWKTPEIVSENKGPGRLVMAPHPFFPIPTALRRDFFCWIRLFDAVEYNHFYLSWVNFNHRAKAVARQFDLPLVGTSDAHQLYHLDHTYTLIYAEKQVASVIEAIKQREVQIKTQPVDPFLVARWFVGNVMSQSSYSIRSLLGQGFPGLTKISESRRRHSVKSVSKNLGWRFSARIGWKKN